MKKKIDVNDLRPGMYVAELDRPWLESPFLFQGFFLNSEDEVTMLRSTCKFVYIDTEKIDTGTQPRQFQEHAHADQIHRTIDPSNLRRSLPEARNESAEKANFEMEFSRAVTTQARLRDITYNMYFDARMGRNIELANTRQAVRDLVDSVLRNPDAQLWLSQLREKDDLSAEHSLSVTVFSLVFGRHLGLDADELMDLGMGAALHDIGKIKVPQSIIEKLGVLTPEEYNIIRRHAEYGGEILRGMPGITPEMLGIVLYHHETTKGNGYPGGLSGENIPVYARIVSIIDSYDAMTTHRSYRKKRSAFDALKELYDLRGDRYDQFLVEQFIQCLGIYPVGCLVELHSGEVGLVVSNHTSRRLKPKILLVLNNRKQRIMPPRLIDLKTVGDDNAMKNSIKTVLTPDSYDINTGNYLQIDQWFNT